MKKLKLTLSLAVLTGLSSTSANAALSSSALLAFDAGVVACSSSGTCLVQAGSYFGMDTNGSGEITVNERMALVQNDGLILGTAQAAPGSHSGSPDGTESPGIDAPWNFMGNTGMHFTNFATNVQSASGNAATIDFSGWNVTWNGIAAINMGGGAWAGNADGVANVTCAVDCSVGDTYTLDYSATVPMDDPSNFGGVAYQLHLVGTVSEVPVPAALWLFGSGLIGLAAVARRRKAQ